MKFYTSDWRADPALRMCSVGARGLWMEMLCIMHEAEPYGSLRVNSRPVIDRQLASLAGSSIDEVSSLLAELEAAGVFSRDNDGVIFSRRMQRDQEKAEAHKANGKRGGNPKLKNRVNPTVKAEDKAQKPEARSQNLSDAGASDGPVDFRERLWTEGVASIVRTTGKTETSAKSMIGKWLRDAKDDCRLILQKIQQAETERIGDPISWVSAAIRPPPAKPKSIGEMFREDARQEGIIPHEQPTSTADRRLGQGDRPREIGGAGVSRSFAVSGDLLGRIG
ncbi:hypothetical protein ACHMW7_16075 [Aminobacter sp. UC22_36]|uniref:hypothetical protein n=1 Tax=Aminobacter sp. UC22_36 TaxID=3374549 RepID=UPI003756DF82